MRKISSQTPLQQRISLGYPQDLLARTSTKSGIFEDLDRIPTRSPSKNLIQQDCPTAPNCRRAQWAQRAQPSRRPWPFQGGIITIHSSEGIFWDDSPYLQEFQSRHSEVVMIYPCICMYIIYINICIYVYIYI